MAVDWQLDDLAQEVDAFDLFAELTGRPEWMRDALCLEHPEVSFFAERGQSNGPAKAVCAGCLVQADCLAYALQEGIEHGVWGGTRPAGPEGAQAESSGGLNPLGQY